MAIEQSVLAEAERTIEAEFYQKCKAMCVQGRVYTPPGQPTIRVYEVVLWGDKIDWENPELKYIHSNFAIAEEECRSPEWMIEAAEQRWSAMMFQLWMGVQKFTGNEIHNELVILRGCVAEHDAAVLAAAAKKG